MEGLKSFTNFFATSFFSSLSECGLLLLFGGASFSSSWFLVKETGLLPHSWFFYVVFSIVAFPMLWISLFWIKILFIPGNRGKISVFSPLPVNVAQISFKNDGLIPVVAGTWLTVWLFFVTVGWCCAVRQSPFEYKKERRFSPYHPTCRESGNFTDWFQNSYLPFIQNAQKQAMEHRKFVLYQPPPNSSLEDFVSGMFTAFTFALVSDRELIIDYPENFCEMFLSPGWEIIAANVWPSLPFRHTIIDLSMPPAFVMMSSHKWMWSDIMGGNVSHVLTSRQLVIIECSEYLAPLIWANPLYRSKLCTICDIDEAYKNFADVFLVFKPVVDDAARKYVAGHTSPFVIFVADSHLVQGGKTIEMLDSGLRCMSSLSMDNVSFVYVPSGSSAHQHLMWKQTIGLHSISSFFWDSNIWGLSPEQQFAALFSVARYSEAVFSFHGAHLGESLAYSSGKPLFSIFQRVPFCGEVAIRLPCIRKWKSIIGSRGINMSQFMTSELTNQGSCFI